jgi:hypothetical protein
MRRPKGIVWRDLDNEKLAAIPVLRRLKHSLRSGGSA